MTASPIDNDANPSADIGSTDMGGSAPSGVIADKTVASTTFDPTDPSTGTTLFADMGATATSLQMTSAPPCYCRGTRVLTDRGERPVEDLAVGDRLITASGVARPLRWVGRRQYGGRFLARNLNLLPVLIRAGALADGVPIRDLLVSPSHAMFLDGVLIAASRIVNGVSILQLEQVTTVEFFHLELATHDVILAEGAPAESFVDDDNRMMFHNGGDFSTLYPDAEQVPAVYCAPRVADGYQLEAVRRRLEERAGLRSPRIATPLRGFVDRIEPATISGWAQNPDHPEAPVCLDILVDGCVVAQTLANQVREDLAQAGFGSGRHGFSADLREPLTTEQMRRVKVRRSADASVLERSKICIANADPVDASRVA